ncbi:transcription factor HES-2-like [Protopterus annectens]|uniref:transcription factor HES-2-like n=1 Tax=Protopterus annectens TaxID=7888 RepID=UPI001CFC3B49|nr:transcription factor HES-2-like [Protopterus annectens]
MDSQEATETLPGKPKHLIYKKVIKPLIEKKRRARMNECLNQLKNILLERQGKENIARSRMDKADILEMAVKHIREMKDAGSHSARPVAEEFHTGYMHCLSYISSYLSFQKEQDGIIQSRLIQHLEGAIASAIQKTPQNPKPEPATNVSVIVKPAESQKPVLTTLSRNVPPPRQSPAKQALSRDATPFMENPLATNRSNQPAPRRRLVYSMPRTGQTSRPEKAAESSTCQRQLGSTVPPVLWSGTQSVLQPAHERQRDMNSQRGPLPRGGPNPLNPAIVSQVWRPW